MGDSMTDEKLRSCSIGGCGRPIPSNQPICPAHRELLHAHDRDDLVDRIDKEFPKRERGVPGAALKYQEAISEATRLIRHGPDKGAPKRKSR